MKEYCIATLSAKILLTDTKKFVVYDRFYLYIQIFIILHVKFFYSSGFSEFSGNPGKTTTKNNKSLLKN